jgi:hypothetical protein
MKEKFTSQIILNNLIRITNTSETAKLNRDKMGSLPSVSLNQIRMWIIPQKSEHDEKYDINHRYFELLMEQSLNYLVVRGLIQSNSNESVEDDDERTFSLTEKGLKYALDYANNDSIDL